MNWTEAVRLAKEGKDQGYDFLYMQTYQKNYYVALRYMKQEDTAQDVLQDAYIKAFNNLEQLQDAEKFPGWMARIVTTTALDELKKRKIVLFSQIQNEDDEVGMEEILEDERTDTQPELAIDQKETKRLVQEMIDTLSEEQKMCIMMYYVEEMSVKEIAQTLNVSENTVKSRLNYGRKNIEAKALELEKKGTKLYGIAPFPFFLYLLHRDVLSVQVAEIPFGTILKQKAASAEEKAGKSILSKASVLTAKKAVIGTVMGLALCGSAAAVIYSAVHNSDKVNEAVNQVQEDVKETEPQRTEPQETEPQETELQETEPQETEPKEAESESIKWQDAYLKFAASIQADDNGYAVLDVAGSDAPVLVVMPDIFQTTSYILSDNSCIYKCCWPLEMYYYDLATDEVIRITDADSDSSNGALVEGYMDLGFYLTYLESEKLLVGDLVGSSAVIETYSVNQQTGHLNGEEAYVDEAVETVERKDIIYYRTVEQAIENIGAVQE